MEYDIIFVSGEVFFDHPLSGIAILKRLLEKNGYSVGVIEMPQREKDVRKLGKPRLFFGVSSGSIDSMVRNYTPLKKPRESDRNLDYGELGEKVPDRAVIIYSNWIRKNFKDSPIVLGGTEASLRRFTHYDYWENRLRKPILYDTRADILAYGPAEKQILEIAARLKEGRPLDGIPGTCIVRREVSRGFAQLPSFGEVEKSKGMFCEMQRMFSNSSNLSQKVDTRFVLQYSSPEYTSQDLDEYYGLPFTRKVPKHLRGFEFSVVTHRGCIGQCNFCALGLLHGNKIVSRSEGSILKEIKGITKLEHFKGNIDDMGGPSANMYGMDCGKCPERRCLNCKELDRSNRRLIGLLRKAREVEGVRNVFVRSGIRYDLASPEYIREVALHHTFDTLRIAPEHVNKNVLRLMNKDKGDLNRFIEEFQKTGTKKRLSFYFMTAHPGCGVPEAKELAKARSYLKDAEDVQVFTPTPMTASTCMYWTGMNPFTREMVYVPYTYREKKLQKEIVMQRQLPGAGQQKVRRGPKPMKDRRGFRPSRRSPARRRGRKPFRR
jgi:uncharacterized radical SAM protein YgiQ